MIKVWDYIKEYESLRGEILEAVDQVFKDGTLIFGPKLAEFEEKFSKFFTNLKNISEWKFPTFF